ncbi:MAG TPA: Crp/Fnr family transcriptional regulator [Candidatus Dormibacteraeota bacterium]|nr:Crp/Fnr family transcriptional regulator [Candidatus Dormibacteraeota bacterium]
MARATPGTTICVSGQPPRLAAITAGLVRAHTWTPAGRQVPLRYASAGDLVGLAAMLGGSRLLAAEAVSEVSMSMLTLEQVRALAERHPGLAWSVAEQVATWAVESVSTLLGAGFDPIAERVARHLVDLSVPGPDGRLTARVTHRGLADAVGTVREVASRTLRTLREQGLVETGVGTVTLLDPAGLARMARGAERTGR